MLWCGFEEGWPIIHLYGTCKMLLPGVAGAAAYQKINRVPWSPIDLSTFAGAAGAMFRFPKHFPI